MLQLLDRLNTSSLSRNEAIQSITSIISRYLLMQLNFRVVELWLYECLISFQSSSLSVGIFTLLASYWNVKSAQRRKKRH